MPIKRGYWKDWTLPEISKILLNYKILECPKMRRVFKVISHNQQENDKETEAQGRAINTLVKVT